MVVIQVEERGPVNGEVRRGGSDTVLHRAMPVDPGTSVVPICDLQALVSPT